MRKLSLFIFLLFLTVCLNNNLNGAAGKIEIRIECERKVYQTTDVIITNCFIKNNSKNNAVLLWSEEPAFRTFIANVILVKTYGWQNNLEYIRLKPMESVTKKVIIEQNKNIPILDAGTYELRLDFAFSKRDPKCIESKTQFKIIGESEGLTKTKILKRAQNFLKKIPYKQKIDYNGVEIKGHPDVAFWTVSFSNKGPVLFGVTQVDIHKKTGDAGFPTQRTF